MPGNGLVEIKFCNCLAVWSSADPRDLVYLVSRVNQVDSYRHPPQQGSFFPEDSSRRGQRANHFDNRWPRRAESSGKNEAFQLFDGSLQPDSPVSKLTGVAPWPFFQKVQINKVGVLFCRSHRKSRSLRAGLPTYTPGERMSLVTTAPAPTTTLSTIVTGSIVALLPMET